jgi:hypothetical protein
VRDISAHEDGEGVAAEPLTGCRAIDKCLSGNGILGFAKLKDTEREGTW